MNIEISRIIHILNPWFSDQNALSRIQKKLPSDYIPRTIEGQLSHWENSQKAHLLIGARQVGKSTLIWKYIDKHKKIPLYLNCEELIVRDLCKSAAIFFDEINSLFSSIDTIFFEEAQHLVDAGLFLKGLVDLNINIPILVTGSSSYHLNAKTRESLAGRATRVKLYPFSFQELQRQHASSLLQPLNSAFILQRQMQYGSYPAVWKSHEPDRELIELSEAFVIRDASDLFRIKDLSSFRQLIKLAAWQIGNLVNYSEWASSVGIAFPTVKHYIDILVESGVITLLAPFRGGKRSEILSSVVIYFNDLGIRNSFCNNFESPENRGDKGAMFENWVFSELIKDIIPDAHIQYWRTKSGAEVDFVIHENNHLHAIEVKYSKMTRAELSRSSRSFIDAYHPKQFVVINQQFQGETEYSGTVVKHILPEEITQLFKTVTPKLQKISVKTV